MDAAPNVTTPGPYGFPVIAVGPGVPCQAIACCFNLIRQTPAVEPDSESLDGCAGQYTGAGNRGLTFRGYPKSVVSILGASYTVVDAELQGRSVYFNSGEGYSSYLSGMDLGHAPGCSSVSMAVLLSRVTTLPVLSSAWVLDVRRSHLEARIWSRQWRLHLHPKLECLSVGPCPNQLPGK